MVTEWRALKEGQKQTSGQWQKLSFLLRRPNLGAPRAQPRPPRISYGEKEAVVPCPEQGIQGPEDQKEDSSLGTPLQPQPQGSSDSRRGQHGRRGGRGPVRWRGWGGGSTRRAPVGQGAQPWDPASEDTCLAGLGLELLAGLPELFSSVGGSSTPRFKVVGRGSPTS